MELYAVKIFDLTLATRIERLIRALQWCASRGMDIVNLSIGTSNEAHRDALRLAVERLGSTGCAVVAAANTLPGSLPGVIAVDADEDCPRDTYRVVEQQGRLVFRASRFPRPIPGQPVESNLQGVSFAVANLAGFVVRARQSLPGAPAEALEQALASATDQ
jgi:subtilisin family serine protease